MAEHHCAIYLHVCRAMGHEACDTRCNLRCTSAGCGFAQAVGTQEHADVVYSGHLMDPTAAKILYPSDTELRELFEKHCECRPLDLMRTEADHAAIHDCDTGILTVIQAALFDQYSVGCEKRRAEARAKLAQFMRGGLEPAW